MKERPILFNGPMVRAILYGRKTQTRRVVNGVDHERTAGDLEEVTSVCGEWYQWKDGNRGRYFTCPYGVPGDRLWVKETFYDRADYSDIGKIQKNRFVYVADGEKSGWKRHPSIFMPRAASRITLEVTGVRVERVQDILHKDAIAEGFPAITANPDRVVCGVAIDMNPSARERFSDLWDQINATRGFPWELNPWVWVVEFKRIEPR